MFDSKGLLLVELLIDREIFWNKVSPCPFKNSVSLFFLRKFPQIKIKKTII
jgi:hypothetical protein